MSVVENKNGWTVLNIIKWGEDFFSKKSIESPRLNIERILSYVLKCKRLDLYLDFDKPLNNEELSKIKSYLKQRAKGYPLQYVLGEVEFYDTVLKVRQGVLIPRPETELLVDYIVKDIKKKASETKIFILDLGTGSGNIPIAIAKSIENCKIYSADNSQIALKLAEENAVYNGTADKIVFFKADIFEDWNRKTDIKFDYIVSNPPYIPENMVHTVQEIVYKNEPHEALFAGQQGTEFYQRIINFFNSWLNENGKFFFEIGIGQQDIIEKFFNGIGFNNIQVYEDLNNIARIMCGYK
ncbi:peptide chain release factor N(5)-glutamine methyltransferase [bacterium]|nr:peptide chain release factor N(5)-glutamine methyltransferase [bacterium]